METPAGTEPSDAATIQIGDQSDASPSKAALVAGAIVGRYVVIDTIGSGGMGFVARAYDPKLRREVALKQLHPGKLDDSARTRLVREAQAMAQLSHPNVVAVYDVEVTSDGAVLAMEFVSGATLRDWLRARRRDPADILAAFVQAGNGLVAAHEAGLVHRDFKPSNVLVGEDGRVRVTDFGLAKPAQARAGPLPPIAASLSPSPRISDDVSGDELSLPLTRSDVVMGTPWYMAPEQHDSGDATPAADQYAFCVALWEGLVGQPPFRSRGQALLDAKRAGAPRFPRVPGVSRAIAAVIERGLAPRPDDRWPAMRQLLRALDRAPVRWGGWIAIGSVTVAALTILTASRTDRSCPGDPEAFAGVWDDARRAQVAAALTGAGVAFAEQTRARVEQVIDAYVERWHDERTAACQATVVHGEQSQAVMDSRMACLDQARHQLRSVVDVLGGADVGVAAQAIALLDHLGDLDRCADVRALADDLPPEDPALAESVDAARGEIARARAFEIAGRYADALAVLAEIEPTGATRHVPLQVELVLARSDVLRSLGLFAESETEARVALMRGLEARMHAHASKAAARLAVLRSSDGAAHDEGIVLADLALSLARGIEPEGPLEAHARAARGSVLVGAGKYGDAHAELALALALLERRYPAEHLEVARARNSVAVVLNRLGRHSEAEVLCREVIDVRMRVLGAEHPETALARNNLGAGLVHQGRDEEAELEFRGSLALLQSIFPPDHPDVLRTRVSLANVLEHRGHYKAAEAELRGVLAVHGTVPAAEKLSIAHAHNSLGLVLRMQERIAEAEAEYREALRVAQSVGDADHPDTVGIRSNLANLLGAIGRYDEAITEQRFVVETATRALGPRHPSTLRARNNLGNALINLGRFAEAELEFRAAIAVADEVYGRAHTDTARLHNNLATALDEMDRFDDAELEYRRSLVLWEQALGAEHPHVAAAMTDFGEFLERRDRAAEAIVVLDRAWEILSNTESSPMQRGMTAFALARALASSDAKRARAIAAEADAALAIAGSRGEAPRRALAAWRADH